MNDLLILVSKYSFLNISYCQVSSLYKKNAIEWVLNDCKKN